MRRNEAHRDVTRATVGLSDHSWKCRTPVRPLSDPCPTPPLTTLISSPISYLPPLVRVRVLGESQRTRHPHGRAHELEHQVGAADQELPGQPVCTLPKPAHICVRCWSSLLPLDDKRPPKGIGTNMRPFLAPYSHNPRSLRGRQHGRRQGRGLRLLRTSCVTAARSDVCARRTQFVA
jgi:hypothetical protein